MKYLKLFESNLTPEDIQNYLTDFTDNNWDIKINWMNEPSVWKSTIVHSNNAYHINLSWDSQTTLTDKNEMVDKINETILILEESALRMSEDGNKFGRINLSITACIAGLVSNNRDYDFKIINGSFIQTSTFNMDKYFKEILGYQKHSPSRIVNWELNLLLAVNY